MLCEVTEENKTSPLLFHAIASEISSAEKFDLLIRLGADIHAKNSENQNVLHVAVWHKNSKVIKLERESKRLC
eukprot:m.312511 g.312511  ORF g.312511 m.312511 type:complete len:73 (+) comp274516_c0_seq1:66-284(+)